MAVTVVTVASGGLPVVDVTATTPKLGLPVTEAANGRGIPVTKVTLPRGGTPVTFVSENGGGAAAWVTPGASVDMDFVNGRYYDGVTSTLSSLMSVSRASLATDLLPSSPSGYSYNTVSNNVLNVSPSLGLLVFPGATNLFLNSTTPANQTITLPSTGDYVLWVNGAGTATIAAGTATITGAGAAINNVPKVINCSAVGTVTVTISGSLNAVQLEKGIFGTPNGTPFIPTAGSPVSRAADDVTFAGAAQIVVSGSAMSALVGIAQVPAGETGGAIFQRAVSGHAFTANNGLFGSHDLSSSNGVTNLQVFPGIASYFSPPRTVACAFDGSGRSISINGIGSNTDAVVVTPLANKLGLNDGTYAACIFTRIALFNSRLAI